MRALDANALVYVRPLTLSSLTNPSSLLPKPLGITKVGNQRKQHEGNGSLDALHPKAILKSLPVTHA